MKKVYKHFWTLLILFELILIVKLGISLIRQGPFILPDESCIMQRARYLIETFKYVKCENIHNLPGGDSFPLYVFFVAPFFKFLSGLKAYQAILILNNILSASLVFPLWNILSKFINNKKTILISIALIIFIPQITAYEQTVMTETLFTALTIWGLSFYMDSFEETKDRKRNKLLTIIFALLAALTRPFGFIIPVALIINELTFLKNKKNILFLIPGLILLIFLVGKETNMISQLTTKLDSLSDSKNWIYISSSIKTQFSGLLISTFIVPLIIFFKYINNNQSKIIKNIKYFLLTVIILNILISTQHIYGYYLQNIPPSSITRYINISTILIIIFSFIFFFQEKKHSIKKEEILFFIIMTVFMLTNADWNFNVAQNTEVLYITEALKDTGSKFMISKNILHWFFIPMSALALTTLALNKRKIFITTAILIIITISALNNLWIIQNIHKSSVYEHFEDKKSHILFIEKSINSRMLHELWRLLALTDNTGEFVIIIPPNAETTKYTAQMIKDETKAFEKADYIFAPEPIEGLKNTFRFNYLYLHEKPSHEE